MHHLPGRCRWCSQDFYTRRAFEKHHGDLSQLQCLSPPEMERRGMVKIAVGPFSNHWVSDSQEQACLARCPQQAVIMEPGDTFAYWSECLRCPEGTWHIMMETVLSTSYFGGMMTTLHTHPHDGVRQFYGPVPQDGWLEQRESLERALEALEVDLQEVKQQRAMSSSRGWQSRAFLLYPLTDLQPRDIGSDHKAIYG